MSLNGSFNQNVAMEIFSFGSGFWSISNFEGGMK